MKSKHQFILTLVLAGALAGPVCMGAEATSQATPEAKPEARREPEPELPRMSKSQVSAEVGKALPKWDAGVLSARDGAKWSAKVGFTEVLKAVADSPLKEPAPKNRRRVVDGERVLRIIPEHGTVRYVNRSLSWKADQTGKLVDKEVALRTASNALTSLGLPSTELGKPRVDTQGGRDASNTSPADSRAYEMYRLVTVNRQIGNLPVLDSRARVAIASSGGIQRLRVNWPPFTMPRGPARAAV